MGLIKKSKNKVVKNNSQIQMAFFDSIQFVPAAWDELIQSKNIYLSTSYLKAIEQTMESSMQFRYILFYKEKEAVAIASFQVVELDSNNLDLNSESKRSKYGGKVLDKLKVKCLINGTLFGSGETSFYFSDKTNSQEAFDALDKGIRRLYQANKDKGSSDLLLVKDYLPSSTDASDRLSKNKYRGFMMEPNMILDVRKEWEDLDGYCADMTSKYRNRIKSIYKKSAALVEKDLTTTEITKHLPQLRELFEAVHNKAKYKLGTLDVAAFIELNKNLKNGFLLKGYFLEEQLVGFSSIFINSQSVDANYVGLNYEFNISHAVYQRILCDLVKVAIEKKKEHLHFGRTAGEIKSTLGAKSVDMKCYVKMRNTASNKLLKPIVKRITTPDIIERNPFKE